MSLVKQSVGYRLAAIADGEGHFQIARRKSREGRVYYSCGFVIKMRDDDVGLLRRLQAETGVGRIFAHKGTDSQRPAASWQVNRKKDCLFLTEVFDRYPLWSKKRRDYAIWREAVILWAISDGRGPGSGRDWSEMAAFYQQIRDARRYAAPPASLKEAA